MKSVIPFALGLALAATTAFANPPLRDVTRISEGLIAAGMAIELGDKCDSVSTRIIRGLNFLQGLKNHASDLGYSNAEIEAYVDDRAEKARLEVIARGRLADLGVTVGDPASYCTVARAQIAAGTQVGQLLR
ncbi:MAG: DUF5333 domain-containing protein [Octadecabacter sp.]|nr:DUF5333 domain-containing protein [Octadecabacter sp.]